MQASGRPSGGRLTTKDMAMGRGLPTPPTEAARTHAGQDSSAGHDKSRLLRKVALGEDSAGGKSNKTAKQGTI